MFIVFKEVEDKRFGSNVVSQDEFGSNGWMLVEECDAVKHCDNTGAGDILCGVGEAVVKMSICNGRRSARSSTVRLFITKFTIGVQFP